MNSDELVEIGREDHIPHPYNVGHPQKIGVMGTSEFERKGEVVGKWNKPENYDG